MCLYKLTLLMWLMLSRHYTLALRRPFVRSFNSCSLRLLSDACPYNSHILGLVIHVYDSLEHETCMCGLRNLFVHDYRRLGSR
jgi:hypothetical protein